MRMRESIVLFVYKDCWRNKIYDKYKCIMSLLIGICIKIFKILYVCFNLYNIGVNKEWLILLGVKF